LKKRLARCGKFVPINTGEAKTAERNTKTEMKTETVTVLTNTLAGLRKAERLQALGWAQIRVTLFSVTFTRRVSK